eukprot:TRINITY_DN1203_c1_g1_i1.p1 TRINITY_DN1203_c1_g1~~TRINITY_DN1203_c1_g1_i1.p1  ORF type:complete len:953 (+),score=267.58 TRINITY_DN1203_c1_g1_i1:61-2919(+)
METQKKLMDVSEHSATDYINIFCKYFEHHLEQFEDVMLSESTRHYYPIYIDAVMLLNLNAKVGHMMLAQPAKLIPLSEQSVVATQEAMLLKIQNTADTASLGLHHDPRAYTVKKNVKVRVVNLPLTKDFFKRSITALRTEDVGQLMSVRGIVIREGSVRMFEASKEYACERCHNTFEGRRTIEVLSPAHGTSITQRPPACAGCSKTMTSVAPTKQDQAPQLRDYQEIKLQDQVTNLKAGTIPRSITVILEDDLAESCRAGDDLITVGVLTRRWHKEPRPDQRCSIELVLHANYIRVTNENKSDTNVAVEEEEMFEEFWEQHADDRIAARDIILGNICPQIYGMHRVKLSLMLVLIGGYSVEVERDGSRTRGECHMLLVGDPGTAKSQFLQFASKMSSRSVCTTGVGSTSAGLTVSAYKEGGEWVLDAGALVIADGGVCCIDEFSTIPEQKHVAIHEAMEQQTISIAKAGLVTTLNTRCSVIAACNPKKDQSVLDGETAIGIATPLLSRFDLVMVLLDVHDEGWDMCLADYVLQKAEEEPWDPEKKKVTDEEAEDMLKWDTDTLKTYIGWLKQKKKAGLPPMTKAASLLIQRYYNWQRESRSSMNKSRRTVRMLESLIRLAQAHSLLVNDTEVKLRDAVVAVSLMNLGGEGPGSSDSSPLHTVAPKDPERDLLEMQDVLIKQLGLADHEEFGHVTKLSPETLTPCKLATDVRYAYPAPQDSSDITTLFASRKTRAEEVKSQPPAPSTKGVKRKRDDVKANPLPPLDLDTPGTPALPNPPASISQVVGVTGSPNMRIPIPTTLRSQTSQVECTPPVLGEPMVITPTVREASHEDAFGFGGMDLTDEPIQPLDLDMLSTCPSQQPSNVNPDIDPDPDPDPDPLMHLSLDSVAASTAWENLDVNVTHQSRSSTTPSSTPVPASKNKPTLRRGGLGNANRLARKKTKLKKKDNPPTD